MNFFKTITIRTPESVELEFTLAGIGNRALALIIDYLLLFLSLALIILFFSLIGEQLVNLSIALGGGTGGIELWLLAIVILLVAALYGGYFVGFETWWQGQTPGKRVAQIRVIKDNGKPEGVFQAALRALMRPIDDILFVGFLCIVFNQQEKRIGDWLAGTLVVQSERPLGTSALKVPESSQALATQLMEQSSIGNLLPDDFAVMREYLQRRSILTKRARQTLSVELAQQVREIIELEKLPQEEMPADPFLEAVYWAYQKQFGDRRLPYVPAPNLGQDRS
ncbi:MAG: RDD family protein [Leptolyngbya sp. SIO1E4]|nr:RDD family protein [Leptolyngbya sp. SIO1E4]